MGQGGELLIFLVDDDKMFLKSLEKYIQQFFSKIKTKTFSTGEECLTYIHLKPDIILLDYVLNANYPSAMNGVEVLIKIKAIDPEIVVIMFSAQDHIDVAVDSMKHGAFDYVVKNDKIFIRIQNAIKNIMYSFSLKKDANVYKRKMRIIALVFFLLILFTIYMQIYFRTFITT